MHSPAKKLNLSYDTMMDQTVQLHFKMATFLFQCLSCTKSNSLH